MIAKHVSLHPDGSLAVEQIPNSPIRIIVRERTGKPYPRNTVMLEVGDAASVPRGHVLLSSDEYLTIGTDESVVIISSTPRDGE